ncbi:MULTISPECIES: DUF805 domain-containing protein [Polaromonas]|uniref:DUF805 domain-containing protein n=1 Tax=Polaromonas aquatica TaxID=332657 RepID=A0ABW1TZK5_9BURK
MNFGQAISTCFSKYATFSGRASRSEFWWFMLFEVILLGVTSAISDILYGIVALALVLPVLAVGARRLHDIGRTGWWQLLSLTIIGSLVLLYWFVQPTVEGSNEYDAVAA